MPDKRANRKIELSREPRTGAPAIAHRLESCFPLLLAVLGLAVYANSLGGPFVFDDVANITHNSRVQQLWPPEKVIGGTLRPVLFYSLALNYCVGGINPWSYKLVNVLIHVAASLALYGVVRRTFLIPRFGGRFEHSAAGLAFAVAALWVVHPLTTESVTYVIHRGESLMGLFLLLALYCLARGARSLTPWPWYLAAVIADWLSMGTKETLLTGVLVFLAYDRTFLGGSWRNLLARRGVVYLAMLPPVLSVLWIGTEDIRQRLAPAAPPTASPAGKAEAVASGPAVASSPPGAAGAEAVARPRLATPLEYFRTQPEVILHYLRLAVWPHPLCVDYALAPASSAERIVPGAVVVGALLLLTLWTMWRGYAVGFLGAAFFLMLAPTSSFLPIQDLAVERRMYLPLAAVITGLVAMAWWLLGRCFVSHDEPKINSASLAPGERRRNLAGIGLLLPAIAILSGLTVLRNDDYRSDVALWESVVHARPANTRARVNLARAYLENLDLDPQARISAALQTLEDAERVAPDDPFVLSQVGNILAQQGFPIPAAERFRKAIAQEPRNSLFHLNLAVVLEQLGRNNEALAEYRLAVELGRNTDRDMAESHYSLAQALAKRGKTDEAIVEYQEALRINPELMAAESNLGMVLAQRGQIDKALVHFLRAVELERRQGAQRGAVRVIEVYTNLASAYGELHQYPEAVAAAEEAQQLAVATGNRPLAREIGQRIEAFKQAMREK